MRRLSITLAIAGGLGLGAIGAACSSNDGAQGSGSGNDSGIGTSDAGGGDGGGDASEDAGPPQAYVRVANLSPDQAAVDVCVAPHGTSAFQGPLIEQLALSLAGDGGDIDSDGGAAPGVAYAQVSAYLAVAPGQYDVRFVAAGATSCDAALERPRGQGLATDDAGADASVDAGVDADAGATDASIDASVGLPDASMLDAGSADAGAPAGSPASLPSLAANEYATLLIAGDVAAVGSDRTQTLALLPDDNTLPGGGAALRAVNAVPSRPALDFGLEESGTWLPIVTDVPFGSASAQAATGTGAVDANGYAIIAPLAAGQALSARVTGSDAGVDVAASSSVEIDLGSIATVFAIGGKTGDTAHPPALLVCTDNQPAGGLLSDCSVAP